MTPLRAVVLAAAGACACATRPAVPARETPAVLAAAGVVDAGVVDAGVVAENPARSAAIEAPWPEPATSAGWPAADGLAPWGALPVARSYCGTQAFNDVVIVCDQENIWSIRLADPRSSVHVASPLRNLAPHVVAGLVIGKLGKEIVALDPRTLAARWQTAIVTPEDAARYDGTQLRAASSDGEHLVLMLWTQWSDAGEIVVLDPATGLILRRAPTSTHGQRELLAVAGRRLVTWEPGALVAVDVTSGRRAWSVELPREEEAFVTADEGLVAAEARRGNGAELTVVEADTGRIVRREQLGDLGYHAMALDRGQLFRARQRDKDTIAFEAVAADTGRVLWSTPPVDGWMASRHLLFLDADVVLANDGHGYVRAYDRSTGAQRWSWGFGWFGPDLAIVRPAPTALGLLVADATVFERRAVVTPSLVITITGQVRDGGRPAASVEVAAAGARTRTDGNGVYRLEVRGRGHIGVVARSLRGYAQDYVNAEASPRPTLNLDVTPRRRYEE